MRWHTGNVGQRRSPRCRVPVASQVKLSCYASNQDCCAVTQANRLCCDSFLCWGCYQYDAEGNREILTAVPNVLIVSPAAVVVRSHSKLCPEQQQQAATSPTTVGSRQTAVFLNLVIATWYLSRHNNTRLESVVNIWHQTGRTLPISLVAICSQPF